MAVAVERPVDPAMAYAGLAVSTLGWASAFIAGKVVLAEMTPLSAAGARYAAATAVLLPFALRGRRADGASGPATLATSARRPRSANGRSTAVAAA